MRSLALSTALASSRDQLHQPRSIGMSGEARNVLELNINHYRDLLMSETDASKRQAIENLLAEEEAKLARLVASKRHDK